MRKKIIRLGALIALVFGAVAWAHTGQAGPRGTIRMLEPALADLAENGAITQEQSASRVAALDEKTAAEHSPGAGSACAHARRPA